jgi:uncharacterized OsmC-like protein
MTQNTAAKLTAAPVTTLNGFDVQAMTDVVEQVISDPALAVAAFRVKSSWKGAARVESKISAYELGGERIAREHLIQSDEPRELFGDDTGPNPQELLLAALNACMVFGYATKASALGVRVDALSIESHGKLDMRGALGIEGVSPGMDAIHYVVRIKSTATPTQLEALHEAVMATSPNRFHIASPIRLDAKLVIE